MAKAEFVANPFVPAEAFVAALVDRPAALAELGGFLVSEAQAAFRAQGWRGMAPWPERRVPNVAGVVRDLADGGEPKARRFAADQTLVDTGRLRAAFDAKVDVEAGAVTLRNHAPYALETHLGGPRGPFPGAKEPGPVRTGLAKFLRSKRGKPWREELGWLFGVASWSYKKVPARNLVPLRDGSLPPALAADVRRIVLSHRLGAKGA